MPGCAIVTGGAGGIGRAVLARLARDGFTPVCWDLAATGAAHAIAVDVTDAAALEAAAARTVAACGPIRALVVNAGVLGPVARVWEASPDEIRRVLDTNLLSAFLTLRAVVPHMLRNEGPRRGAIVLMASVQGKEGTALAGPYAASKAGLIALAKTAGKELATDGIAVNAVTPTVVRTAMEASLPPARRAELLAKIPMARFIEPAEVAAMVAWLCGPDCSFSTGAVFDLSGGRSHVLKDATMLAGEAVVAIWNGIAPEAWAQFHDWHMHEHMPERVGIPGFVRGRRYGAANSETAPEFFTLYEALSMQVLQGGDYTGRLNAPTPWTRATTAHFRETSRALARVLESGGPGMGGAIATIRFDAPAEAATALIEAVRAAGRGARISGAHLCRADDDASGLGAAESRHRTDIRPPPAWFALLEAVDPQALAEALPDAALHAAGAGGAVLRGVYRLEYIRTKTAFA